MNQIHPSIGCATRTPTRTRLLEVVLFLVALVLLVTSAGCARSPRTNVNSPQVRAALLHNIAADYARTQDLQAAQTALANLKMANPAQLLIGQAEEAAKQGQPVEDVAALADLAGALGARSRIVAAYLTPTDEPVIAQAAPATPTASAPAAPAESEPTATALATKTPAPTVVAATAIPVTNKPVAAPRVTARDTVNLRGGPATTYAVVGQLKSGDSYNIVGRNASGDWWRLAYPSEDQVWVNGLLVEVAGPIDTIAVVKNIPAAPTAAPQPTAVPQQPAPSQPTQPPAAQPTPRPAGQQFVLESQRLRPVGQGQECSGGNHGIYVTVLDAAGKPLNGVKIKNLEWAKYPALAREAVLISGQKAAGSAEWVTGKDSGGQMVLVDDAGNPISDATRILSNYYPDPDFLLAGGYCACESFDEAACRAAVQNQTKRFAMGHYFYEVVFRRSN